MLLATAHVVKHHSACLDTREGMCFRLQRGGPDCEGLQEALTGSSKGPSVSCECSHPFSSVVPRHPK
jgi:hypothetical protein